MSRFLRYRGIKKINNNIVGEGCLIPLERPYRVEADFVRLG